METKRLIQIGHHEITTHLDEADRLRGLASDLLDNAEWHTEQARQWQQYIGGLICPQEAVVIPLQQRQQLIVIQGGEEGA